MGVEVSYVYFRDRAEADKEEWWWLETRSILTLVMTEPRQENSTQGKTLWNHKKDVDGASCPSRCSIAPHVPNLPPEAIEFAEAVGQLCEKYSIAKVDMKVEVDRFTREHEYREDIVSDMTINVSTIDRRGRPRKKIYVQAQLYVSVPIVWEPDSTN